MIQNAWNCRIFVLASTALLAAWVPRAVSGPSVGTITWDPAEAQDGGSLKSYSGTLTEVAAELNHSEGGEYSWQIHYEYTFQKTLENCCDTSKHWAKKEKVAASSITVNFKMSGTYKIATWADRDDYVSSRPNAVAEWDRVYNDTVNHEKRHHANAKAWFTKAHVQPFVVNRLADVTSICDPDSEKRKLDIKKKIQDNLETVLSDCDTAENEADDTDYKWPYTIIDTAKDN